MTLIAFQLIFASVFLHAFWHCLCKSQNPVPAFFLGVSGACFLVELPIALASGIDLLNMPAEIYLWAFLGGLSGMICDAGLAYAYRMSDVSLAYPLARALPVLLTAGITMVFRIGKTPSSVTLCGMAVVLVGSLMMPLQSFSGFNGKNYLTKSLFFILIAAAGTTCYTVFDSIGLRLLLQTYPAVSRWQAAVSYGATREFFLGSALWIYVLSMPFERKLISGKIFFHPQTYIAGVAAGAAYILVLIAMMHVTNVSFVQAFRQMSLPVGFLTGILIFREKCPMPKLIGVILVVLGLVLTVL